nr:glutamine amidotransferase [uncultured Enterobacter sp.]
MPISTVTDSSAHKTLLLIQAGTPPDDIRRAQGDLSDWFKTLLSPYEDRFNVVRVFEDEPLPAYDSNVVVVITGSWAMVTDKEAWSERTAGWIKEAVAFDVPVFGVCYGHQLMAHALGGDVDYHPRGLEFGCRNVVLNAAAIDDPLLDGFPPQFPAHLTHMQTITRLPEGAVALASSDHDAHQIVRYSSNAYSTQFHPEFTPEIARSMINLRAESLREAGKDPEQLLQAITTATEASAILTRFIEKHI